MILHELMEQLHGVEAGKLEFEKELAGEAAGAIEILKTKLERYETLEREGRLKILRPQGKKCGGCVHFLREGESRAGHCEVRHRKRHKGEMMAVVQSRTCCLDYKEAND